MRVLVTGGAGYVGSHAVKALLRAGHSPVVLDNLSQGHRELVLCKEFVQGNLLDTAALRAVFTGKPIDAMLHCAAQAGTAESLADPIGC